jgi:Leucine-rich repeat (LRR) protein
MFPRMRLTLVNLFVVAVLTSLRIAAAEKIPSSHLATKKNFGVPDKPAFIEKNDDLERLCLISIFAMSTKRDPWVNSSGWNTTTPHCTWFGVSCGGDNGHILTLNLGNNQLNGPFPDFSCLPWLHELLVNDNELEGPVRIILPSLSVFDASGNYLSGALSSSSFQVPNLSTLILKNNSLSGDLAFISSSLPLLSKVDLWLNSFSGPLPDISGKAHLAYLDLSENNVEGPLDALFGGSTSTAFPTLIVLLLRGNRLSGNLTGTFFDRLPRLEYFNVISNLFGGPLPERLPPSLLFVGFSNNEFRGPIPLGWGERLQNATDILLENNMLTGTIPDFLGALPRLKSLTLSMNKFTSSVPAGLGRSTSLIRILLDDANLEDELPQGLFSGMTSLSILSMMGNRLTGALPDPLPPGMVLIHLSSNKFSGPIPSSYSSLVNLTDLRLEGNNLTGGLPALLTTLPKLEKLLLSRNGLSKALPGEYSPSLATFSVSDNDFAGAVPAGLCGAKTVLLSGNRFTSVELGRNEKDCKVETLGLASAGLTEFPLFWPTLRVLKMGDNSLTSYSGLFGRMSKGVYLGLANTLSPSSRGSVTFPSIFGEVREMRHLETLDLTGNGLTGTFSQALFQGVDLPKLRNLLLAGNNISGPIPSALGLRLVGLSFFNLSGNAGLTGGIPDSLSTLSDADATGTGLYDSRYVPAQGSVQVKYHDSMLCSDRFVPEGKTSPVVLVLGAAIKEKKTKQNIWGKNKKRNLSKDFKKTIPRTIRTRTSKKNKKKKKKRIESLDERN